MSTDKMREEFEAWWQSTPILRENKRTLAEKAWQASRASLVIELPKSFENDTGKPFGEMLTLVANAARDECQEAIKAAGVKTK